jgi:hypothetical protein
VRSSSVMLASVCTPGEATTRRSSGVDISHGGGGSDRGGDSVHRHDSGVCAVRVAVTVAVWSVYGVCVVCVCVCVRAGAAKGARGTQQRVRQSTPHTATPTENALKSAASWHWFLYTSFMTPGDDTATHSLGSTSAQDTRAERVVRRQGMSINAATPAN